MTYRTFDDLLHYCRCVAGSIGRLSLGVFGTTDPEQAVPLADSLGVALQLTNILKDIREDLDRGFCWLPRTYMERHGLSPGNLIAPEKREAAVALLDDLVAVARHECDVAFEYSLILPRSEPGLRLFCLWPLLFAPALTAASRISSTNIRSPPRRVSPSWCWPKRCCACLTTLPPTG